MVEDVEGVNTLSFNHFKEIFQEPLSNMPLLEGVSFSEHYHEDMIGLEDPFCLQDIKEVIWNGVRGKSPEKD